MKRTGHEAKESYLLITLHMIVVQLYSYGQKLSITLYN